MNCSDGRALDEIMLNLNFDMIGSPNYARFVYDGDNSGFHVGPGSADGPDGSGLIEAVFVDYFRATGASSRSRRRSPAAPTTAVHRAGASPRAACSPAPRASRRRCSAALRRHAGQPYDPCYHPPQLTAVATAPR